MVQPKQNYVRWAEIANWNSATVKKEFADLVCPDPDYTKTSDQWELECGRVGIFPGVFRTV